MDDKPATTAYNDHNVYILGAGFAAEAGMPLIGDFMNRMRDAAAWLETKAGRDPEIKAIGLVLDFRLKAAAAAYRVPLDVENIEQLFSLASASGDEELAHAMPLAISATLDYARQTAPPIPGHNWPQIGARDLPQWKAPASWGEPLPWTTSLVDREQSEGKWYSCPPYEFYVGIMAGYFNKRGPQRCDTIITFNYDLLVEEVCRNLGIAPGYGIQVSRDKSAESLVVPASETSFQILKLHGSVNWANFAQHLRSPDEEAGLGQPSSVGTQDWEKSKGWPGPRVFRDYSEVRKKGLAPLLLPPTWGKHTHADQYSRMDFSAVWDAAVRALREATNVIVLGYSIPQTDLHFKYLLAAGLQENISLRKVFFVNPALKDEQGREMLENRLFGPSGLFRREHLEQGVIELIPADTHSFFTGPHDDPSQRWSYRERIGRPLNDDSYAQENAPFRVSTGPTSWSWR